MLPLMIVVVAASLSGAGQVFAAKAPAETPVSEMVARRLVLNATSIGNIAACQRFERDYAGKTEKLLSMTYTLARQSGIRKRSFARQYRKQVREAVERQTKSFSWRAKHPDEALGIASIQRECALYWTIFQGDMQDTKAMLQQRTQSRSGK